MTTPPRPRRRAYLQVHCLLGLCLLAGFLPIPGSAQDFTQATFQLLEGSTLIDDCPVCGRPTLLYSLRGTFDLVRTHSNPLFSTYVVTNLSFNTSATDPESLTGNGLYTIGGEVAVQQRMTLNALYQSKRVGFTNDTQITDKLFPLIAIQLSQTNPTLLQALTLNLVAAPAREIWFSTANGFTPADGGPRGSGGDLLSARGNIVMSASNLVAALELPDKAFPVNLDAIDLQPGGEIWFSLSERQLTSRVGLIQDGDLLSNRGRIVKRNQELTAAFGIMPVVPDVGLDAVTIADDGEIFFSITTEIFAERAGRTLHRGDVLSNRGVVVASNQELLARFHPPSGAKDYGLDALYVWPSGEIWFSLEDGFQDKELGSIQPGDLLSNQGLIIRRNLDLLSAFAPLEDLADFGLDALFIVTDLRAAANPPRLTRISRQDKETRLEWEGAGRAFQLLRAGRVIGPFEPVSPILPVFSYDDQNTDAETGFYRVRQW